MRALRKNACKGERIMRKSISVCLVIAILLSLIPGIITGTAATPARGGYTLAPVTFGRTGVDVSSSFILTSPDVTTAYEVAAKLSIDGQPQPDISAVSDSGTEFIITPVVILASNTLYIFRITREYEDDITWAFQTARRFQITSNFPANEATNVPINTGIEVTFSEEDFTAIDYFFSIYPNVAGRFETRRNTAVFVPTSRLEYQTVYTVTIRAGIRLEGTNDELLTDYVWSFETAERPDPRPPRQPRENWQSVSFDFSYVELPTIEPPSVRYNVSFNRDFPRPQPRINVYRLDTNAETMQAIRRLLNTPRWSRFAREENFIDTRGLTRVTSFDAPAPDEDNQWSWMNTLEFPQSLPQGFYLIEATVLDNRDQMIIQINDLPIQIISDDDKTIFWVNDIVTGGALAGATVRDSVGGGTYTTDEHGVAVINRAVATEIDEQITVTARDGRTAVWLPTGGWPSWGWSGGRFNMGNANEAYWTALQLDRTLFQPDDTLYFWGFAQCRRNSEQINYLTAVLRQGGWSRWSGTGRDILHRQVVHLHNGVYSDEIRLPMLDTGSYVLTIYHGDIVLNTMHFSVENYVKPPYQITVSADRRAIFVDEEVTFTATAAFFEGTPLPELDISYRVWGWGDLNNSVNESGITNMDGEISVSQTPIPRAAAQGQTGMEFTAEATLPEIGRTMARTSVQVFINDIDVRARATREKGEPGRSVSANITVDVNSITLDRINDGTSRHWGDFLDEPVNNQNISVNIYREYWVRINTGEVWYSHSERRTFPIYRHERREERINSFNMRTNSDGVAERNFTLPNRERESYFARIQTVDGNGRTINHRVWIGRDWSSWWWQAESNDIFLQNDSETGVYALGDDVTLTLMRGVDTVTSGNFLFVNMQRGIQSFQAGQNPYTFEFSAEHIPNVIVHAYHFNGFTYESNSWNMSENIRFDFEQNDLIITVETDQETYQPGDMFNANITVTDIHGNPVEAAINISVVDEALFALQDYTVNTLSSLYHTVSSGLRFTTSTHRTFFPSDETVESMSLNRAAMGGVGASLGAGPGPAPAPPMDFAAELDDSYGGADAHLREVFEDTAHFAVIHTNAQGTAQHSFRLPDNITSWRLTVSGISNDLHAGNLVRNIIVTMPMFLNYSINSTFLTGDFPTLGVNVFGTSLAGGETVEFQVWDESNPYDVRTAGGAAFERVNIPLWEMAHEGSGALIIRATVSNGMTDMVRHQYQVLRTYRQIDAAVFYDNISPGTDFVVGSGGLTNITFTDRSRGRYLWQLTWLRNSWGSRIERMVVRREANNLLRTYFPDLSLSWTNDSFDARQFQQSNGGIAILPHAEADLLTTVRLMPFIMNEINIGALRNYLYNIFKGDNADNKIIALYGLAILREPVLLYLNNYALLDDLSIRDLTYIALGYHALGEVELAAEMYDTRIAPYLEGFAPYYRVNVGVDMDDILDATSAALTLAQKLERPEVDGLYLYLVRNRGVDLLTNLERLAHIRRNIGRATAEAGSITYTLFGEEFTRDLSRWGWGGGKHTLRIPAQNMHEFRLIEVTGDVSAVSTFRQPMSDAAQYNVDHDITVRRRFYRVGGDGNYTWEFEQGDIVRVNLWIDYSAKAIQGSYVVTDFLPAGLQFIPDSARIPGSERFGIGHLRWARVEGQRVQFFDHNSWFNSGRLYYYYARVISPGTFRAEGTLVQNLNAPTYFTIGEDDVVVIR